ncbi:PilC/PilY family type IV pilus protein [Ramlibacter sp. WS9]|uniref:PilC/PilY family type IV pilus protein n=1 Tax=Ramlibacter sp. WS9 TaxID=1882741 RepID=UPI001305342E|nr:PilC/PilY family type IV pilus protein [Ramlibacter sp. WS9]
MKKFQLLALMLATLLVGYSASLHAEDTDIYVSNTVEGEVPNVLFVLDNGANFSSSTNGEGCSAYTGTTEAPSLGTDAESGILQCALVNAINSLGDSKVKIGLVVSNANNFGETQATTNKTKGGYHEPCEASGIGGCVLLNLTLMDAAAKANLIAFIKGWKKTAQSDADGFNIKVNSSTQATSMQEAWAYYAGRTGLSGRTYSPSLLESGCQKNFIVYISNTQKNPANEANPSPGASALATAGASSTQQTGITGTVKFNQSVCEIPYAVSPASPTYALATGNNWADEWARFMYQNDGGASGNFGTQNITSYAIAILGPPNKCSMDTLGMMSSMAAQGHGSFFLTSSVADLTDAFNAVLNEVQAVNSVFSSASLPVSVNAQGTYLNQIYLGMFRPDASASPRWMGNLKQFKLVKNASGNLVLGDALGNSAISAAGTGFITPTSVSYWTTKTVSVSPDSLGGMFKNDQKGTPLSGFDSPDGEVVEKGGAAQQLRKEGLTATFAGASNTSGTNPRRMYTYCPAGSSCNASLTHTSNDFSTTNGSISASAFGTSSTQKVTSITRSGTTVTGTTSGTHGMSAGASVQISGVTQSEYNGTFTLVSASGNSFTYSIAAEYPNTTSQGQYTVSKSSTSTILTDVTLSGTTATVSSGSSLSAFPVGSSVAIGGFNQSEYNGTFTVTAQSGTTLSYGVTLSPPTPAQNTYTAAYANALTRNISGIATSGNGSNKVAIVTTTSAHGFHLGQSVKTCGTNVSIYGGTGCATWTISAVGSSSQFTIPVGNTGTTASTGTVTNDQTPKTVTLTRSGTTATATFPSNWFANGDVVNIEKLGGSATNEDGYKKQSLTIAMSCTPASNTSCTTFTYSVAISPTSPGTVGVNGATISVPSSTGSIAAGAITRSAGSNSASAVQTISSGTFANGDSVSIAVKSGTSAVGTESAYVGNFTISCTSPCSTFSFSGFPLTPTTPGSGSSMSVYSATTAPDRDTIIKWLRGSDNYGDELGPGGTVTVRPSVHADVLHSRPLVINYGGNTDQIVVYYGTNDGVFHATNGNQSTAIGSVPAGGELWSMVLPEHYSYINRQRLATPELKFPTTALASAESKDYFVDGPTGAYQKLNADGTINTAYIYLTMRRGGRFIYGLDVTTPAAPQVLWKINAETVGFEELGQTWSRPRFTLLQSSGYRTTPVLIFGAGYDPNQDSEPPGTDTMGRGIYIVNAVTGALIWSATPSCTTSDTCLQVPDMKYAIPSDVAFVDRNSDGYTDKLYVGDLGGNIWRIDVAAASRANWAVTKIAALGCSAGECSPGTTPRKFFFPPAVLSIKVSGVTGSYDAISMVSGDREHPLKSSNTSSAHFTEDKFFMVMDKTTAVGPATFLTSGVTPATLDATAGGNVEWVPTTGNHGFKMNFLTGEKGVNAPLVVNGSVFFSTNQPSDSSATCAANLGTARAYAVSPFTGESSTNVLSGGGLPPSPVAGLVSITTTVGGGEVTNEERFCIGCGLPNPPGTPDDVPTSCAGNASLQNCTPLVTIPANLKRTYWYKK